MASVFGKDISKLEVNYEAHAGQVEIGDVLVDNFYSSTPAHIIEVIASRGWGKTLWLSCEILIPYLEEHPDAKIMWVAPTYQIAMSPIEDVFRGSDEATGKRWVPEYDDTGARVWEFKTTQAGPMLLWHNGATVTFKSADAPESIVSRGYNFIIIDEAALIEERVFTQQILGTARKAGIKIFMITSPRGKKHWTYKYFLKGQDPKDTDYLSFQQPYTKNPFFSPVLAKLIRDLPDWLYRQEYLAEFIEDGDSVFRGLEHVIEGVEISFPSQQQEWVPPLSPLFHEGKSIPFSERQFVAGLDLAKSIDYTVLWIMSMEDGSCVYYKRMNKTDYRQIVKEVADVCKVYNNCDLIFDATGVGSGIADFLQNEDVNAIPFHFTNDTKSDLINKLALSIEYQEIKIPNITTIKNELSVFTYAITRTGKISYNAPAGYHDDIVIALALANFYRKDNFSNGEIAAIDDILSLNNRTRKRTFLQDMEDDND